MHACVCVCVYVCTVCDEKDIEWSVVEYLRLCCKDIEWSVVEYLRLRCFLGPVHLCQPYCFCIVHFRLMSGASTSYSFYITSCHKIVLFFLHRECSADLRHRADELAKKAVQLWHHGNSAGVICSCSDHLCHLLPVWPLQERNIRNQGTEKEQEEKVKRKQNVAWLCGFVFLVCIIFFFSPALFLLLFIHFPLLVFFFFFFFSFLSNSLFLFDVKRKKSAVCCLFVIWLTSFSAVFLLFIILRLPCAVVRRLKPKN